LIVAFISAGHLHREQVIDRFSLTLLIHLAVPVVISNGVGHQGGIDHEFAHPVASGLDFAE
jgi:hypothetical protein